MSRFGPDEREVMPGVYMTDRRQPSSSAGARQGESKAEPAGAGDDEFAGLSDEMLLAQLASMEQSTERIREDLRVLVAEAREEKQGRPAAAGGRMFIGGNKAEELEQLRREVS